MLLGLLALALARPAAARPYLMVDADERGFRALDLGGMQRGEGLAEATLIEAPLAGALIGDKLAPLVERRMEVDCERPRWRVLSTVYADAREAELGRDPAPQPWRDFGEDAAAPAVQEAACQGRYRTALLSRRLNLGEILTLYQAAHSPAAPQPPSEKELAERRFRNGH